MFPAQTHFYSYQILCEYFREFPKSQPSWSSSAFRMPFQEQRLPTPLGIKKAVILRCRRQAFSGSAHTCGPYFKNAAYWEDFLEPAFHLRMRPIKLKPIGSKKWNIPYRSCGGGPLIPILPYKSHNAVKSS